MSDCQYECHECRERFSAPPLSQIEILICDNCGSRWPGIYLLRIDPVPPDIQSAYTCPACGEIFNPPTIQEIEAVKGVPKATEIHPVTKNAMDFCAGKYPQASPAVEVVRPLPKRTMDPDGFSS